MMHHRIDLSIMNRRIYLFSLHLDSVMNAYFYSQG